MKFKSITYLRFRISLYFTYIKGIFHFEDASETTKSKKTIKEKVWDRQPEPPTLTGLALHLGFNSLADFENYENTGEFGPELKRSRLRIEGEYEKKLHQQAPTGAIFALKAMGWNERDSADDSNQSSKIMTVNMVDTGVPLAGNEKDVAM
jgi:hypothetical protein